MLTDERIKDVLRPLFQSNTTMRMAIELSSKEYRAIEAEVRKEQADKIEELTRQLAEARKDSERLHKFLAGDVLTVKTKKSTVIYGSNKEVDFRAAFIAAIDAAIKAKEQP